MGWREGRTGVRRSRREEGKATTKMSGSHLSWQGDATQKCGGMYIAGPGVLGAWIVLGIVSATYSKVVPRRDGAIMVPG